MCVCERERDGEGESVCDICIYIHISHTLSPSLSLSLSLQVFFKKYGGIGSHPSVLVLVTPRRQGAGPLRRVAAAARGRLPRRHCPINRSGFRVQSSGLRVSCLGFTVQG